MLSVPVYNSDGLKIGEETLDPALLGGEVNKQLLHDVVRMHLANRRVGTVNTRGRSDVAGSTRKMYRQKGTGNARMGAKRTHKRVGGGVAFARRNRDYSFALPKRAVRAAVRMAILSKFQDGQALIVDGLETRDPNAAPRTRTIARILQAVPRPDADRSPAAMTDEQRLEHMKRSGRLGQRKKNAIATGKPLGTQPGSKADERRGKLYHRTVLIGLPDHDPVLHRSARNIEGVLVAPVAEFNTYDVLRQRYLLLTRSAFEALKQSVEQPITRRPDQTGEPSED